MKNLFIGNMHKKSVNKFTSDLGLLIRRKIDKPFKKLCNIATNANIIKCKYPNVSDDEYFSNLDSTYINPTSLGVKNNKNNIVLERYPKLDKNTPYIFVCNHTTPEDIETVLNILDRNAYLILGSIESLQYNPEMYLSWLNGMMPFDIMDKNQRKESLLKMQRILRTNSILIFPEGSHNYSPNKLVNNLFDGPINLANLTGRKLIIVSMLKDFDKNISYIDVSNPIDVNDIKVDELLSEKERVKAKSLILRDKMATSVYHLMERHFEVINREYYDDIEEYFRQEKMKYDFSKLKWNHDVFEAEYLTKKTDDDKSYEEVINTLSNLVLYKNNFVLGDANRKYILELLDLERKNTPLQMKLYWLKTSKQDIKKLSERK